MLSSTASLREFHCATGSIANLACYCLLFRCLFEISNETGYQCYIKCLYEYLHVVGISAISNIHGPLTSYAK